MHRVMGWHIFFTYRGVTFIVILRLTREYSGMEGICGAEDGRVQWSELFGAQMDGSDYLLGMARGAV